MRPLRIFCIRSRRKFSAFNSIRFSYDSTLFIFGKHFQFILSCPFFGQPPSKVADSDLGHSVESSTLLLKSFPVKKKYTFKIAVQTVGHTVVQTVVKK